METQLGQMSKLLGYGALVVKNGKGSIKIYPPIESNPSYEKPRGAKFF